MRRRTLPDRSPGSTDPSAAQLRQTYENAMAARANGWRANPFSDPYAMDWPGRRAYAAAWTRGCADWESRHKMTTGSAGCGDQPSRLLEVGLAASRDHNRRMLEHQEKLQAQQAAAPAAGAQLKIPLIGEVRRPEPSPPKRRRPRTKKPIQPTLGEA